MINTVEVTNRFKGLDLIECLKNYGWRFVTLYRRQYNFFFPKKKKCKKAKWLSEEALQIAVKRRAGKSKGEKERYSHLNVEFQRIARREKKAYLSFQCKQIEENNRIRKTRDLFKKIRNTKGTFHASLVQFSHSVVSDSLRSHEPQHARPPCPSPTPRVHQNPRPLSW